MEEALRAHLLANSGVQALAGDRLDWGLRPAMLPSGRLQVVGSTPFYTFDGRDSLTPYRVQIEAFGETAGAAKQLARAIDAAMTNLPKPSFDSAFLITERDDVDTGPNGQPVHRALRDYRLFHRTLGD